MSGSAVYLLALLLAGVTWFPPQPVAQIRTVYLAEIKGCWYSFPDKRLYDAAVAQAGSVQVAQVDFYDGRVKTVGVTQEAESGDWINYDHYVIGKNGAPVSLDREVRFAEGDRRVRKSFRIVNGSAELETEANIDPRTGKWQAGPVTEWLPAIPVATALASFPFHRLIADAPARRRRSVCGSLGSR